MKLLPPILILRAVLMALAMALAAFGQNAKAQAPAPAPQALATDNPDLNKYETFYKNEVREKVDAPYLASIKTLTDAYRVSLDNAMKRVAAQGVLDGVLALQTESKRFTESKDVPESDEPGIHVEVAKLRASWRAEMSRLETQHAKMAKPVAEVHVARLRTLEKELVRALKIDQAIQVRARADELTAQISVWEARGHTAQGRPAAPVPAPAATPRASGLSTASGTPRLDWVGKTVRIIPLSSRASGVQIKDGAPIVAPMGGLASDAASFKVQEGKEPGTVTFESVAKPGFHLRHQYFKLRLMEGVTIDALFRLEKPMEGNEGLSIAAQNYQAHHLSVNRANLIILSKDPKELDRNVFIFEEVHR